MRALLRRLFGGKFRVRSLLRHYILGLPLNPIVLASFLVVMYEVPIVGDIIRAIIQFIGDILTAALDWVSRVMGMPITFSQLRSKYGWQAIIAWIAGFFTHLILQPTVAEFCFMFGIFFLVFAVGDAALNFLPWLVRFYLIVKFLTLSLTVGEIMILGFAIFLELIPLLDIAILWFAWELLVFKLTFYGMLGGLPAKFIVSWQPLKRTIFALQTRVTAAICALSLLAAPFGLPFT